MTPSLVVFAGGQPLKEHDMPNLPNLLVLAVIATVLSFQRDSSRRWSWNVAQFIITLPLVVFGYWLGGAA